MTPSIDVTSDGPICILTINNVEKRNAFSGDMAPTLRRRIEEADADTTVRAIVITGAGHEAFSSGHDLQEVLLSPETAGDPEANAAFTLPARITTPVIGAINGSAYAAGFILALNCDLRVAGDNARFGAVGAKIGLVPVGGQLSRLLSLLSYQDAFRMLTTAEPLHARDALANGFITQICAPEQTLDQAIALGKTIAGVSPSVVNAIKAGLANTLSNGLDAGQSAEGRLAGVVQQLPDGSEGVSSFLERRPAVYSDAPATLVDQFRAVIDD